MPPELAGEYREGFRHGYEMAVILAGLFNETPPNDGHRQSILNGNFHQVGVGCVLNNATGVYWWTQDFGS